MRSTVLTAVAVAAVALAGCGTPPPPSPSSTSSTSSATSTPTPTPTPTATLLPVRVVSLPCEGVLTWALTGVPASTGAQPVSLVGTLLNAVADVTPIRPVPAGPGYPAKLSVPIDADVSGLVGMVLGGYGVERPTTTATDLYSEMPRLTKADAAAVKTRCRATIADAMKPKRGPQPLDCFTGVAVLVVAGSQQSGVEGLALVGQVLAPAIRSALPIMVRSDAWAPNASLRGKDVIPPMEADLVVVVGDVPGRVMNALPAKAIRVTTRAHPVKDADMVAIVHDVLRAGYGVNHPVTTLADIDGSYHHDGHVWPVTLAGADGDALRHGCGLDGT